MADLDIFVIRKQPLERRTRSVDFSEKMPIGATITGATVAIVSMPTLESRNAQMLESTTCTVSGGLAAFVVYGGITGTDYRITVTATLSTSDILTADILLRVKEY